METTNWVTGAPLCLNTLLRETEDVRCGALQVFCGTVREMNDGRRVSGMTYEAHVAIAAKTLRELEREVLQRFDVLQCRIQHRTGELALGDASVLVVVRSPHRGASFEAGRYAIDTLKERVTIWKHEHYTDGDDAYLPGTPLAGNTERPDSV